ncbi:DUF92 domain-containing protein [Paenibacillus sp. UMB4589-SE434]|uniref:DUF92 domain-containing protein n=1 Tax=Paenibacillus sp. UMB4589-SE434 TaxID=3046314 RepID=UPI00254B0DDC|nr:DUF92 domain-containing protein [Paenibacillus sp. UMB4589-SE434]MDK8182470.1 DUF92 domain-containing protein [Paenibacillus sp. UMB4589-SE434]
MDWLIGLAGSIIVAGLAYRKRSLTQSGALAAVVMGTVYYGSGSLIWFGLLLTFFITSTFWSKWNKRKKSRFDQIYKKTGERDAHQVMANGGLGMLLCVCNAIFPHPGWLFSFAGVMATVNADTWATEIGSLSRSLPRSVLTGKRVPAGTSGAVSTIGTIATMLGAATIGGAAVVCLYIAADPAFSIPYQWSLLILIGICGTVGGIVGAFTDSFLGATIQAAYHCEKCGANTERTTHCGQPTTLVKGFRWMTNDIVNGVSSVFGGVIAWLIGIFWL